MLFFLLFFPSLVTMGIGSFLPVLWIECSLGSHNQNPSKFQLPRPSMTRDNFWDKDLSIISTLKFSTELFKQEFPQFMVVKELWYKKIYLSTRKNSEQIVKYKKKNLSLVSTHPIKLEDDSCILLGIFHNRLMRLHPF